MSRSRIAIALVSLLLLVGGGVVAYNWAAPLLALREMRNAMLARDPVKLEPLVDWPTLRSRVEKDAVKQIHEANDGKFLEFARNWIGEEVAEEKVQLSGTPKGLIRLACDNKADGDFEASKDKPCVINGSVDSYGYEGEKRFRMVYKLSDGRKMGFLLGERPAGWQLVHLTWVKGGPKG